MYKALRFTAVALWIPLAASAATYYDSYGRVVGSSSEYANGAATYYDSSGRAVGSKSGTYETQDVAPSYGRPAPVDPMPVRYQWQQQPSDSWQYFYPPIR